MRQLLSRSPSRWKFESEAEIFVSWIFCVLKERESVKRNLIVACASRAFDWFLTTWRACIEGCEHLCRTAARPSTSFSFSFFLFGMVIYLHILHRLLHCGFLISSSSSSLLSCSEVLWGATFLNRKVGGWILEQSFKTLPTFQDRFQDPPLAYPLR